MKGIIKCYLISIKDFITHGIWIRHFFVNPKHWIGNVITTENSFRVSEGLQHKPNEQVHRNVYIEKSHCLYCGKEHLCWAEFPLE